MRNRVASAFFLAVLFVPIGGCDLGAASQRTPDAVGDVPKNAPPSVRYGVDPARNRVWLLNRDGVSVYDVASSERIAVTLPGWLSLDAPYGSLPALALGPKGEAVITSNVLSTLWRVDPETLAVSVHPLTLDADTDKDVGFSALVYSSEHEAFFAASDAHGTLWRIEPGLQNAREIWLSVPLRKTFGLAVLTRVPGQQTSDRAELCARSPEGGWVIDFEPGQRSAYVRASSCTDRGAPGA